MISFSALSIWQHAESSIPSFAIYFKCFIPSKHRSLDSLSFYLPTAYPSLSLSVSINAQISIMNHHSEKLRSTFEIIRYLKAWVRQLSIYFYFYFSIFMSFWSFCWWLFGDRASFCHYWAFSSEMIMYLNRRLNFFYLNISCNLCSDC